MMDGRLYFFTKYDSTMLPISDPIALTIKNTIDSLKDIDPCMMNCVVVDELVKRTLKPETAAATSGMNPSPSIIGFKIIPPPIPKTPAPIPEM